MLEHPSTHLILNACQCPHSYAAINNQATQGNDTETARRESACSPKKHAHITLRNGTKSNYIIIIIIIIIIGGCSTVVVVVVVVVITLYRVFTDSFLQRTIFLGYTRLQLFSV